MNALVQANSGQAGAEGQTADDNAQYLTFMLSGEMLAIGILAIREIIEYGGLTTVPMMPDCVRGVINLRGAVVPVMDLSSRFGKEPTVIGRRTCIVIVEIESEGEQQVVGVMVDAVNAVLEIPAADVEPPPSFGARIRTDFIKGMGKINGKFVVLLNIDNVLSPEEVGALAQVAAQETDAA